MTNVLGGRAVLGVVVPATNTAVEAEYNLMCPPGVTFHTGRIWIKDAALDSDESFDQFLVDLRDEIGKALRDVAQVQPDHLVMGMSAETFWGGVEGNREFEDSVREQTGMTLSTGAAGCLAALKAYGGIRRIGIITPYQPIGDRNVRRYFTELGYDVASVYGLKCPTAQSIADVSAQELRDAFRAVDGDGVDALVQVGTNLPCAVVAAELEAELGKPVIAINTASVWHALRSVGVTDSVKGFGALLEDHPALPAQE
ncbi:arylmalonate decarboxylase [Streptomyces sp. NBC_01754]|uniref:maleate cis-trans isomerase family protein n=1 Tax=Streptomyces sp. NBC_01754 TaxID=2975930 RepID=UPI002DD92D27|nr:arylmalonate decarboxylase [Streptomyces sp. NBC_01754]WSC91835.1 arylmalonate decarboxylase [Streptomyces sp. NBC_01754]